MDRRSLNLLSVSVAALLFFPICGMKSANTDAKSDQLVEVAAKLFAEKKTTESIGVLKEALKLDPENAKIYETLGEIYLSQNDLENAEKSLNQAASMGLDGAALHNMLGMLAMRKGDGKTALSEFSTALKLDPNLLGPNVNMADIALASNHPTVAAGFYKKALEIDPGNKYVEGRMKQIEMVMKKVMQSTVAQKEMKQVSDQESSPS